LELPVQHVQGAFFELYILEGFEQESVKAQESSSNSIESP